MTTRKGPQRHGGDIHHLNSEQIQFLVTGRHYFPFEPAPFPDHETARKAWELHRDAVKAWCLRQYGPRVIWAEQQFDTETNQ